MAEEQKKWREVKGNDIHDFEAEPILEGEYADREEEVGMNKSKLYSIKKEDGTVEKVWGTTILDSRMADVALNSQIQIELKGTMPNKYGKETKIYAVRIRE